MKTLLTSTLFTIFWLASMASQACTVCRPKVQAAIHNADYSMNVALLLLPVAVLLLLGLGLYYAANLLPKPRSLATH